LPPLRNQRDEDQRRYEHEQVAWAKGIDGINLYGAEPTYQRFRVRQQLWRFGPDPEQVGAFLSEYGWQEVEQLGSAEFTARYIRPTGRAMPLSEMERAVYAVKR
jgi:O-methyltransferase involved in polyketide biosynthesis